MPNTPPLPELSHKPPAVYSGQLRLGVISFINTLPIYHPGLSLPPNVELYYGAPSTLNRWMDEGRLDVSPVSSAYYLENTRRLVNLKALSVSSFGGVESVLYITRHPMDEHPPQIAIPDDSATSVAVLRYLLTQRLGADPASRFRVYPASEMIEAIQHHGAGLVIGDRALALTCQHESGDTSFPLADYLIYDMATAWVNATATPLVFATWVASREALNHCPERILTTLATLSHAHHTFNNSKVCRQAAVAQAQSQSPFKAYFSEKRLLHYWQKALNFDWTDAHDAGLAQLSTVLLPPDYTTAELDEMAAGSAW